jgi:hypothetical protein
MALIGRCRDDLSRVLRIARPGFPDWQVERHGVRRHWWLTFGLFGRLPSPGQFSSSHLGPMTAGLSTTPIFRYVRLGLREQSRVRQFLSLPSSSAIGRQITDVVTSGGQSSTKFVLRTMGVCSRRGTFAVPVTLTVS